MPSIPKSRKSHISKITFSVILHKFTKVDQIRSKPSIGTSIHQAFCQRGSICDRRVDLLNALKSHVYQDVPIEPIIKYLQTTI